MTPLLARLRRGLPLAAVTVVVAVVTLTASLVSAPGSSGSSSRGSSELVLVSTAVAVCPAPVVAAPDTASTVGALVPDAVLGADVRSPGDGAGSLVRLGAAEDASVPIAGAGTVARVTPPADGQPVPVVATADGALAPGLTVQQSTRTATGQQRGRSAVSCAATGTDVWFVGGGSDVGRVATVFLTNLASEPARVDVTVYGPDGPVVAPGGRGVEVPAGAQQQVALDALAPGVPDLAVRVTSRSGSVAAAVYDTAALGLDPLGTDWVPASAEPATSVVIPGLAPAPDGSRVLSLLAPGEEPALVRLQVVAPDGTFTPTDIDVVDVSAGVLTTVDLAGLPASDWSSLVLESDEPVVAGVRQVRGAAGEAADFAHLAGSAPLTGPTAVVDGVRDAATETTLLLTAPVGGVRGSLVVTVDGGQPATTPFEVAAGTTSVLPLAPDGASFTAVVAPDAGSDPLYAARWVTERAADGPMVTAQPLTTAPITVVRRPAVQDLRTGLP